MLDLLLRHNADVNARGYFDLVPLALTSHRGYVEIARLLLEHGSPVDPQSKTCDTISGGYSGGHHEIAQLLLEHGAERE
jgi:uncharacterized protein